MKAVIVANGTHAPSDRRELADADLVLAADGGAAWLAAVGVVPDRLVGDLDSIAQPLLERLRSGGRQVEVHPPAKDASDLELCVSAARAAGADDIVLLGALGGRVDHQLANLLLLAALGTDTRARAVAGGTTVHALAGPGSLTLAAKVGSVVSLLAVGDHADGVRTAGLRWPLDGERLELGSSRGLSNVVASEPATVQLADGRLLVIEVGPDDPRGGAA